MENSTTPDNSSGNENNNCFGPPFTEAPKHTPGDGHFVVRTAHHATAAVLQKAANAADSATNNVENAASFTGRNVEDAANYVGQKTGDASAAAGSGLRSLGQNVRESGPATGVAGEASAALADSLDKSGRYLEEEGIKEMADDITNLIRRNPIPAMLVGIAAGYMAGRAMSPRS